MLDLKYFKHWEFFYTKKVLGIDPICLSIVTSCIFQVYESLGKVGFETLYPKSMGGVCGPFYLHSSLLFLVFRRKGTHFSRQNKEKKLQKTKPKCEGHMGVQSDPYPPNPSIISLSYLSYLSHSYKTPPPCSKLHYIRETPTKNQDPNSSSTPSKNVTNSNPRKIHTPNNLPQNQQQTPQENSSCNHSFIIHLVSIFGFPISPLLLFLLSLLQRHDLLVPPLQRHHPLNRSRRFKHLLTLQTQTRSLRRVHERCKVPQYVF